MIQVSCIIIIFISVSSLIALPQSELVKQTTCQENEVLVKCVEPCQPSCSWPDRPKCPTFACSEGCECASGYRRATNETNSSCIKCKTCKDKGNCGKHEILATCGNPCQPSCSWKKRPPCPTFACTLGCVCRENYYRATNETNSPCIMC